MQLYDKIFQVANENMTSSGLKFSFGKTAFESILCKNPELIEVSEFDTVAREEFLTAVYLRCLNRLPDCEIEKYYSKLLEITDGDDEYTRYSIFNTITKSIEFKNLDKKIEGLKEMRRAVKHRTYICCIRAHIFQIKAECVLIIHDYFFEPIWKRLPNSFRNVIRVICGREKK